MTDTEIAEHLTRATLQVLSQRTSGGEARDLEVFVQRVADRAFVDFEAARAGVRAVFQTLREAVTGDEFEDVLAQLPREYTALLEEGE
jgi:uncharacterized protein (DUF2267 family)